MRISKLMMPALTLAGALALAGCGGGSDTPAAVTPPSDDMKDQPVTQPATKTAAVPNDGTVGPFQAGLKITLAAGDTKNVNGVGWLTCESGTCAVEVPAGTSVSAVSYTGTGTLTIRTADHRLADTTAGTTPRPEEATDPLSNDVLLKALKTGNSRMPADNTVWNAGTGAGGALTDGTNTNDGNGLVVSPEFTPIGGPRIDLSVAALGAGVDAYYGYWAKSTADLTNTSTGPAGAGRDVSEAGTVYGGATPYGKKPEASLGTATYHSTGRVLFYYSNDDSDHNNWRVGNSGNTSLNLTANFGSGMVGGNIDPDTRAQTTGDTPRLPLVGERIRLGSVPIGDDGTFSGTNVTFADPDIKRDSGSWEGGFFGPSVTGNPQVHSHPSHVAGEFSVSRPKIGTDQNELHIRGAFGGGDCMTGTPLAAC